MDALALVDGLLQGHAADGGDALGRQLQQDLRLGDVLGAVHRQVSGRGREIERDRDIEKVTQCVCGSSWRNHFARSTAMKFNCFFLVPFLEDFPAFLVSNPPRPNPDLT